MSLESNLPRYECHKVVRAAKVVAIDFGERLDLMPHGIVEVGAKWIADKHAEVGGYYVLYDDGYASFSPAKAFEDGYKLIGKPTTLLLETAAGESPPKSEHPYPRF